ncbi:hypothetical protein IC006_0935 [Sulfuracidifex tepidarius]|uniref:Uncharacterized protein n=1 Tax=Sulfuracidifex tepidarius TaxID=1294262 RepID=A0A510E1N4_9CREN|nr:hypothetical protein IC006_0935 [Sulfuracidifex tepidarius]BBG26393.1 hypothetical protein IC007_0901 [Sulfuracidifex tepidarius]
MLFSTEPKDSVRDLFDREKEREELLNKTNGFSLFIHHTLMTVNTVSL